MSDNWKHRSDGMRCHTCMFFVPKVKQIEMMSLGQLMKDPDPGPGKVVFKQTPLIERQLGRCRRHAPTMSGFPAVFETDWCGDHKLDENKL